MSWSGKDDSPQLELCIFEICAHDQERKISNYAPLPIAYFHDVHRMDLHMAYDSSLVADLSSSTCVVAPSKGGPPQARS